MVKVFVKNILFSFFLFFISVEGLDTPMHIKTTEQATELVKRIIQHFPADSSVILSYEKNQTDGIIKSAKMLYDSAREQILQALSEIDNRITYWQYQKDHPWNYFVSKNPAKWFTGPAQQEEIENNLELLASHQGEMYVLLGQLSAVGTIYTQGFKDVFLRDYHQAYEWVDKLLDSLVRIKTQEQIVSDKPFIARLQRLQLKLESVGLFKDDLLTDIAETKIPSYIERNWLKGGVALFGLGYTYNNLYDQAISALQHAQQKSFEYVVDPVTNTVKDIITPGWQNDITDKTGSYETNVEIAKQITKDIAEEYKLQKAAQEVLTELDNNNFAPYWKFLELMKKADYFLFKGPRDILKERLFYLDGQIVGLKLEGFKQGRNIGKQYEGVGKLILLIPAALASHALYAGYQKMTEKNYGQLRRALVDINSLFIEPSKPLSNEEYGKMVYLIHMLKKRAIKELPTKRNMRSDFIQDLQKIESQELSVAAKRAIIEDMFKKYSFLALIPKK